jgi:hypothetical protein
VTTAAAPRYVAYRTHGEVGDASLLADPWRRVPRTPRFVDVVGGTPALYDTTAAVLWDDRCLYVGFWCESPFVQASVSVRDELVCVESDVEVFIDGGETYYELQLNARNTVFEAFYIWKDAYTRGGRFDVPDFDVRRAFTFAGNPDHDHTANRFWTGTHARGNRWSFFDWDFPGLQTAVDVRGTLNDPSVEDEGWTAQITLPWQGMRWLAAGRSLPPTPGDELRVSLARYEKFRIGGNDVFAGWVSTPIGSVDNHRPEHFTEVVLTGDYAEDLTQDSTDVRF